MLKILKKLNIYSRFIHIKQLRRFRKITPNQVYKNSEKISNIEFEKNPKYLGEIEIINSNLNLLATCKKSGSWVKLEFFGIEFAFWTSRSLKYFPNLPKIKNTRNFGIGIIRAANLYILKNTRISKSDFQNSLNIYNQTIKRGNKPFDINNAFYLCVSGADQFQHFVQDLLPILAYLKDELNKNPNYPIILNKPSTGFRNFDKFFELLGISNPKIFIDQKPIKVKNLYFLDFKTKNAIYCLPQEMYSDLFNTIQHNMSHKVVKEQNLVCFLRQEKTRNFENENEIKLMMSNMAQKLGCKPLFINPSIETLDNIIDILSNAKYVFGSHGGAMFNTIFANKHATIIEFITSDSTDSLMHMIRSFGHNYIPYAVNAGKSSQCFKITQIDMNHILESLNKISIS